MTIARLALTILIHLPYVCYGDCNPKDWAKNVLKDGRSVLLSNSDSLFRDAKTFCEDQGGQLVTFRSEKDHQRITEWTREKGGACDDRIFIGLTRPEDEDEKFRWVDGRPLDNATQKWAEGHPQGPAMGCVSTGFCSNPTLKSELCSFARLRALCESFEPCTSRIVISVNGIRRWHGKEVTLPLNKKAEIECALRGNSRSIAKIDIMISCGTNFKTVRATELSKAFEMDGDMDKKTCSCKPQSQMWKPSEITVSITASPSIVGGKPIKIILSKEGEKAVLDFEVVSAPKPKSFSLTKDGAPDPLNFRWYEIKTEPVEGHPLRTRVTLVVKNLQPILTGSYKLTVSNDMEDLNVRFFLGVESIEPPRVSPKIIVGGLTTIFMLATSVCMCAGQSYRTKDNHEE